MRKRGQVKRPDCARRRITGALLLRATRGSPGIDGPACGGVRDPYDVLLVRRDGSSAIDQSYR
jgi:hypothetical protein